jgi:hypothetical protein
VTGDEYDASGTRRIGARQRGDDVHNLCRFADALAGLLDEAVHPDLKTPAACFRVAFEFRANPFARRSDPAACCNRRRVRRRQRAARVWKLTSFSIVCRIRAGETSFIAAAICGAVVAREAGFR